MDASQIDLFSGLSEAAGQASDGGGSDRREKH